MRNYKREIEDAIINVLNGIEDTTVQHAYDFTEQRTTNMIVVGITREQNLNISLPDYRYSLEISVNSFIDEDKDGKIFESIVHEVDRRLSKFYLKESPLEDLFGTDEIVYFEKENVEFMLNAESRANQSAFNFTVIGSFYKD